MELKTILIKYKLNIKFKFYGFKYLKSENFFILIKAKTLKYVLKF
jgi:hypothetical protein